MRAGDDRSPSFSSDGSRIAFERDGGGIHVVPAVGGVATMIAPQGRSPRFSPDGKWIAYWTGVGSSDFSRDAGPRIYVVPSIGGTPTQVQSEFAASRFPVWAPDGKHIVFFGSREPGDLGSGTGSWDWWVAPIESGPAVRTGALAVFRKRQLGNPVPSVWTAEGGIIFAAILGDSKNIWQIGISPKNWRVTGLPQQLTSGAGMADLPAAAAGGRIVFSSPTENIDIWSLPIDHGRGAATGEPRRLTENASLDVQPAISADGRRMAFVTTRAGNSDVWLKELRTGEERPITTSPANEWSPAVSADGSHLAYLQFSGNKREIHVAFMDGRSQPSATVCDDCFLAWDWSPDTRSLLYWSADQNQIGLLDVASREKTIILRHPIHALLRSHFSPDGHWIAFAMIEPPGSTQLFVAPFQGMSAISQDKWVAVANGNVPRWSPDGNSLYFVSNRDGSVCVWRQRLEPVSKRPVGEPRPVYHSHGARRSISGVPSPYLEISIARDKIVFPMKESTGNIWLAEWNR